MRKVFRLAVAFLREHPARVALTSLATMAATCLVIWIAAGYDSLLQTFDYWASQALGHYQLSIGPIAMEGNPAVPREVLDAIRSDASVAAAEPVWMSRATVRLRSDTGTGGADSAEGRLRGLGGPPERRSEYKVLALDSAAPPFDLEGTWLTSGPDSREAVLTRSAAERLRVRLGDTITVTSKDRSTELPVIGLLDAPSLGAGTYAVPQIRTPGAGDLFVSNGTGERIFGTPPEISFIGVAVKPEADLTRFRFGWGPKLSRYATPVQFQEAFEIEEALDESASADNVRIQSYATTGIAMLVAMLVIFGTVSMGVTERVRQFAVLRALVLTRTQLSLLIFTEALLLALIGFAGGLLLSWLLLAVVGRIAARLLHHGTTIGVHSLALAAVATFGGAVLAAIVPAWRATRARPVDAMAPGQAPAASRLPMRTILLGIGLILVNPLVTFVFPPRFDRQVYLAMAFGFVSMSIGFVLIAPAVVALVDRFGGPGLARLFRIDPKLLSSQITSHVWRTAAAALSMAVGLGLFLGVQIWGFTMLDGFLVGPWAPDGVLAFQSGGLPLEKVPEIAHLPGVDPAHCLPIVVEQPRLLDDVTGSAERASVIRQDNVVLVGIDPRQAFGGDRPLFDVEWAEGSPEQAIKELTAGRGCLVPDHFLTETKLRIGDSFDLVPPEKPTAPVRYRIAGALRLPGWHWQTKLTGFRSRTHRAAALVFANYGTVAEDFSLPAATHLWLDFAGSSADPKAITAAAKEIYAAALPAAASGADGPKIRLMAVEDIRQMTRNNATRWIWGVSLLPLVSTAIAGLGVLNVILASIRSRRWELGVLRSIGIGQSSIVRAILAEGFLIGLVAVLLSLGFGLLAGWCGCGMAQYISFFGGLHPSLHVPWRVVGGALSAVLVLSTLAAVWPALSIGRLRPLTLLQQGRVTF